MDYKLAKIDQATIVNFLAGIELFKKLSKSSLENLASTLIPIYVEGGTTLIQQGDLDSTLYIVFQGRLRVHVRMEDQVQEKELFLAEITPGQVVGEIALLTHLPRTTTVRTVRDSILLMLDGEAFKKFEVDHPAEVIAIAKMALKRLAIKTRPTQIGENFVTVAVAPAGNSDHRLFIDRLVEELSALKPTFLVTKEVCDNHFGKDITQSESDENFYFKMTEWLQSLENTYGYIVYETDSEMTPWTERCIRQADRLLFISEHIKSPELNSIERTLKEQKRKNLPYIEIVFIHPEERTKILGTEAWLKERSFYGFYHIKLESKSLIDKFMRFLTGKAFGVVLNGGGARGMVHGGVLKAIQDLNTPIDFIAGASMGAIISAAYCCHGVKTTTDHIGSFGAKLKNEWTLPLMSLMTAQYASNAYHKIWGDNRIEDLWIRFFCVSTNLTEARLQVHDRGLIWLAVRASSSVPAIYPPIYDDEGDLLVDGGSLNNMPVDIMRKMICGGKILAVNCHITAPEIFKKKFPQRWVSGWKLFFQNLNPFAKSKTQYDSIINILMASIDLSIKFKQNQMAKEADMLLEIDTQAYTPLDFNKANELIEIGYRIGMEKLPGLLAKLKSDKGTDKKD